MSITEERIVNVPMAAGIARRLFFQNRCNFIEVDFHFLFSFLDCYLQYMDFTSPG